MATITVRDLEDEVHAALRRRAALNGRSMEAEVRAILTASVGFDIPAEKRPRTPATVEGHLEIIDLRLEHLEANYRLLLRKAMADGPSVEELLSAPRASVDGDDDHPTTD